MITVEVGCWERGLITLFPLLVRPGGAWLGFPLGKTMAVQLGLTLLGTPANGQAGWGYEVLAIPAQWGLPGGQCLLWSSHRVGGDVSRKAVWGSPCPLLLPGAGPQGTPSHASLTHLCTLNSASVEPKLQHAVYLYPRIRQRGTHTTKTEKPAAPGYARMWGLAGMGRTSLPSPTGAQYSQAGPQKGSLTPQG